MLDIKSTLEKLRKLKARKILIQAPEGLKTKVQDFATSLEKRGIEVSISCDPCYGACDILDREAMLLGCDALLHIGHTEFSSIKPSLPVIYDEYRIETDPVPLLKKNLEGLKAFRTISLVTTLQYLSTLPKARKFLESQGKEIYTGSPSKARYPGQILGCDHSAALPLEGVIECFLFLGTGLFHPLGLAMKTKKPVLFLDMEKGELRNLGAEKLRLQKIRAAHLAKAHDAENFGILVSTKPGQLRKKVAERVKKTLESKGKRAWILVMNEIAPSKLLGLKLDCLVNCACPRLTDDYSLFKKPVLEPEEVEKAIS